MSARDSHFRESCGCEWDNGQMFPCQVHRLAETLEFIAQDITQRGNFMSSARAATLNERAAFLLALFAKPGRFHGDYVAEKVEFALQAGVTPATLEARLDTENRARYHLALHPDLRAQAKADDEREPPLWERAWDTEEK